MNTMHLKGNSGGPALTFPPFLLSLRIIMLCHCSSSMTNFLVIFYGTLGGSSTFLTVG